MSLGSSDAVGPDGQAVTAREWTGDTWARVAGAAVNTPTLGADVIVNGNFAVDADWTKGAGWTIAAGKATATGAISTDLTAAVDPLTLGDWYQTEYTISGYAAGNVRLRLGGIGTNNAQAANGTFTDTARAIGTSLVMVAAGFTGSIDNLSAKVLTLSELFASLQSSTADVLADVNVTLVSATDGKQAGLVCNLDSAATPANFVIAYLSGTTLAKLDKCVAGVYTNVISAAVTYIAGATLRVIKDGTEYRLFYNGAAVGSAGTISDAGIISNTLHGLFSTSPLNSLDNFQLMSRGTDNAYSGLDSF